MSSETSLFNAVHQRQNILMQIYFVVLGNSMNSISMSISIQWFLLWRSELENTPEQWKKNNRDRCSRTLRDGDQIHIISQYSLHIRQLIFLNK